MLVELRGWQNVQEEACTGNLILRWDQQGHPQSLLERHNLKPQTHCIRICIFITNSPGDLIAHQFWDAVHRHSGQVWQADVSPRAVAKPTDSKTTALIFAQDSPPSLLCTQTHPWLPTMASHQAATPTSAYWSHQHNPTLPALGFLSLQQFQL